MEDGEPEKKAEQQHPAVESGECGFQKPHEESLSKSRGHSAVSRRVGGPWRTQRDTTGLRGVQAVGEVASFPVLGDARLPPQAGGCERHLITALISPVVYRLSLRFGAKIT